MMAKMPKGFYEAGHLDRPHIISAALSQSRIGVPSTWGRNMANHEARVPYQARNAQASSISRWG